MRHDDNLTELYGYRSHNDCSWEVVRTRTRDGYNYEKPETVFQESGDHYLGMTDIGIDNRGYILVLKWARDEPGLALWAFGSPDGEDWKMLLGKPVYHDHDSFGVLYDPHRDKWITYQATYLPWDKPYGDNIPGTRRVLHIRTSDDGVHWDPSEDVWMDKPAMPSECLMVPD